MFAFMIVIIPAMMLIRYENKHYRNDDKMPDEWLWQAKNGHLK